MKIRYHFKVCSTLIVFCIISIKGFGQDIVAQGKNNFTTHCSFCHHIGSVLVGPDLANVDKRHSREWLLSFVKSSQSLVKSGDKDAAGIFDKFKVVMPDQADLSASDINNIISYISSESVVASVEKPPLVTPFFAKANYLPISKNNFAFITFYLVSVSLLIMALFFAVTVQVIKRNTKIKI